MRFKSEKQRKAVMASLKSQIMHREKVVKFWKDDLQKGNRLVKKNAQIIKKYDPVQSRVAFYNPSVVLKAENRAANYVVKKYIAHQNMMISREKRLLKKL